MMLTFDGNPRAVVDSRGTEMGMKLAHPMQFHDGRRDASGQVMTYDSTGAFLVGELERLDMTMHEPLYDVTYARDIDLRDDVTIADEASSFTLSTFASAGGLGQGNSTGNGKSWIGKVSDQISGIDVDIAKTPNPLDLWGMELKYSIPEIESAAKLGRPIDGQKYEGMMIKHEMDVDEMVYIGDTGKGAYGLVNNTSAITPVGLATGTSGSTAWGNKTPDEILADVNTALTTNWINSGYAVMPDRLLLPPAQFGYIATQKVSQAGNVSILSYILENNIITKSGRGKLEIFPVKWLTGVVSGGTIGTANGFDRMVAYKKEYRRVRYPMTELQRTPLQFNSIYHATVYLCRLGRVEFVYPATFGYYDGL